MTPENARLVIEAIVVTMALSVAGGYALYAFAENKRHEPGAIDDLTSSNDELARRVRALERGREQDHASMMGLQVRIAELEIGIRILIAQIQREKLTPEWTPTVPRPVNNQTDDYEMPLPPIIAALFSIDEIDDLALRLGVDAGKIDGNTTDKRARALVAYLQRRGRLDELIALARQLRPDGGI